MKKDVLDILDEGFENSEFDEAFDYVSDHNEQITLIIPKELLNDIRALADSRKVGKSEIIRRACERYLSAWHRVRELASD